MIYDMSGQRSGHKSASTKVEVMAPWKTPTVMLIADGDDGQIMALLGNHVMEKLIFDKFKNRFHQKASEESGSARRPGIPKW